MAEVAPLELEPLFLLSLIQSITLVIFILGKNYGTIFSFTCWDNREVAVVDLWLRSSSLKVGLRCSWLAEVVVLGVTDQSSVRKVLATHGVVAGRAHAAGSILGSGIGATKRVEPIVPDVLIQREFIIAGLST